jgi:hypothetical protein
MNASMVTVSAIKENGKGMIIREKHARDTDVLVIDEVTQYRCLLAASTSAGMKVPYNLMEPTTKKSVNVIQVPP